MGLALKLFEELTDAGESKERAGLIAQAFEALETRYPEFKEMATQGHVREAELRLHKEIKADSLVGHIAQIARCTWSGHLNT